MDGCIVRYEREGYAGEEPPFLKKNGHYFGNLKPDENMLELMYRLYLMQVADPEAYQVYVLTSIAGGSAIFNEHFHDKIVWLSKYAPYIDINHVLISVTSKRDAAEYITNHTITRKDILIDDFNRNLNEWVAAGGTAIKYYNGINSPDSFNGNHLRYDSTTDKNLVSMLVWLTEAGLAGGKDTES